MKKLFASDLDGTLLTDSHVIDNTIRQGIESVLQSGNAFAIATGRHMHHHQRTAFGLSDLSVYSVTMNGAIVLDPSGNAIMKKPLNNDLVRELFLRLPHIDAEAVSEHHKYVKGMKEDYIRFFQSRSIWNSVTGKERLNSIVNDSVFNQTNDSILTHTLYKLEIFAHDEYTWNTLQSFLKEYSNDVVNAPGFSHDKFEITADGATKENGILLLADMLNISPEDVYVYGDGPNDIGMLDTFSHSYATSNAQDIVKTHANREIGSNNDYAVVHHMLQTIEKS